MTSIFNEYHLWQERQAIIHIETTEGNITSYLSGSEVWEITYKDWTAFIMCAHFKHSDVCIYKMKKI